MITSSIIWEGRAVNQKSRTTGDKLTGNNRDKREKGIQFHVHHPSISSYPRKMEMPGLQVHLMMSEIYPKADSLWINYKLRFYVVAMSSSKMEYSPKDGIRDRLHNCTEIEM